jgi:hypothetical protein
VRDNDPKWWTHTRRAGYKIELVDAEFFSALEVAQRPFYRSLEDFAAAQCVEKMQCIGGGAFYLGTTNLRIKAKKKNGGTVGGKRRIFNFFESAPIKAFVSL